MGRRESAEIPISAEQLLRDFGDKSPITRDAVGALAGLLGRDAPSSGEAALGDWLVLFRKTCGQDWPRPASKLGLLAAYYGIAAEGLRPESVLFALHTWYALLVQLLAGHVTAHAHGLVSPAERLASAAGSGAVRDEINQLHNGGVFRNLGMPDPFREKWFSWYAASGSRPLDEAARRLASRLREYDPGSLVIARAEGHDLLKPLYQGLFPRSLRHALGEYYTPDWLAQHVLDQAGYQGEPSARLLDPTCGSGTFLLAAIRRLRAQASAGGGELCRQIAQNIVGFDLHPMAVTAARANYLLAVADLLPQSPEVEIPIYACDAILDGPGPAASADRFDYVVGNPPWIAWDNLPADYRDATKPLWERYGLFSLSARDARHGGGKKDLSMLVLYVSADRYLRHGGHLGMVVTQTLFQTKGAGDGFRQFRLGPDGPGLRVLRVDDLVAMKPFGDAANWTSTIVLEKGTPTQYPVPYVKWSPGQGTPVLQTCLARPIQSGRPGSPWLLWPEGSAEDLARLVGRSDYTAHLGANSGGANAVYWLDVLGRVDGGVRVRNLTEKGKSATAAVEAVIEPDLLYPLVRWIDVQRFAARPSAYLLLVQDVVTRTGLDEEFLRRTYPRTYAYLKQFEPLLGARAAYRRYQDRRPFYSMYNVGSYTLSPVKVVWRRMDRRIRAAVLEEIDDPHLGRRPVVPQETCVLVACDSTDEAHYLCALLNSSPVHELVAAHSVAGGKGFGTPSILDFLPLGRFDPADPRHVLLAAASREAHLSAAAEDLQRRIDRLAGEVWGAAAETLRGGQ